MPNFSKFVGVVKAGRLSHTDIQTYRHTDIQTYRQRVSYRTIPFWRSKILGEAEISRYLEGDAAKMKQSKY